MPAALAAPGIEPEFQREAVVDGNQSRRRHRRRLDARKEPVRQAGIAVVEGEMHCHRRLSLAWRRSASVARQVGPVQAEGKAARIGAARIGYGIERGANTSMASACPFTWWRPHASKCCRPSSHPSRKAALTSVGRSTTRVSASMRNAMLTASPTRRVDALAHGADGDRADVQPDAAVERDAMPVAQQQPRSGAAVSASTSRSARAACSARRECRHPCRASRQRRSRR